nr:hypothetical protein [Bacillus subtilis]
LYFVQLPQIWVFNPGRKKQNRSFRIYRETLSRFVPLHPNIITLGKAVKKAASLTTRALVISKT